MIDVGARHVDVALREETQNLREEVSFALRQLLRIVLDVLEHRHFGPEPVHLLGLHEGLVGPGIAERLEAVAAPEKALFRFGLSHVSSLAGETGRAVGHGLHVDFVFNAAAFDLNATRSALRSLSERL